MRIAHLLVGAATLLGAAIAADQDATPNYEITYTVIDQEAGPDDVAQYEENGVMQILYTAVNNEDSDLTILGISGALLDPISHDVKINLSTQTAGPYVIKPGMNLSYGHRIPLSMVPGPYNLAPRNFVSLNDDIQEVTLRQQPMVVHETEISVFDFRFLFLQLCLSAATFGVIYWSYQRNAAAAKTKKEKKLLKKVASKAPVDASWLPETHTNPKRAKSKKVA